MNDHDSEFDHHAHPVGPEIDDSGNPTAANPEDAPSEPEPADEDPGTGWSDPGSSQRPRSTAGREMLIQLQQMIDTVALQAAPVMRDVAAKAAELAAVAAEKAGPAAHRAAEVTESVGGRVAARSKEFAADLRRPRDEAADDTAGGAEANQPDPPEPRPEGSPEQS